MPRYWIMTPSMDWDDWNKDGIISLKWNLSKSYMDYTCDELEKELKNMLRKYIDRMKQIVEFSKTMQIGDFIYLRKNDCIIAYGKVTSDYIFDPDRQRKHIRKVEWISSGAWDIDKELPHKDLKDITDDPIKKAIMDVVFEKE